MPNKSIEMNKLRTIIRLYEERTGLKSIAALSRTSRNSVKKYIHKWNTMDMSYEAFRKRSDAELHKLFCIPLESGVPTPRMEALERLMPDICKELGKKGMATLMNRYLMKNLSVLPSTMELPRYLPELVSPRIRQLLRTQ